MSDHQQVLLIGHTQSISERLTDSLLTYLEERAALDVLVVHTMVSNQLEEFRKEVARHLVQDVVKNYQVSCQYHAPGHARKKKGKR